MITPHPLQPNNAYDHRKFEKGKNPEDQSQKQQQRGKARVTAPKKIGNLLREIGNQ